MNDQELVHLKARIQKYERAEKHRNKLKKAYETIEAIKGGSEHSIRAIVFDVVNMEVRYVGQNDSNNSSPIGCSICSFNNDDHDQFMLEFLEWAESRLSNQINSEMRVMDEA